MMLMKFQMIRMMMMMVMMIQFLIMMRMRMRMMIQFLIRMMMLMMLIKLTQLMIIVGIFLRKSNWEEWEQRCNQFQASGRCQSKD